MVPIPKLLLTRERSFVVAALACVPQKNTVRLAFSGAVGRGSLHLFLAKASTHGLSHADGLLVESPVARWVSNTPSLARAPDPGRRVTLVLNNLNPAAQKHIQSWAESSNIRTPLSGDTKVLRLTVRAGRDEAGYANSDGESGDSDGGSDGEGDGGGGRRGHQRGGRRAGGR